MRRSYRLELEWPEGWDDVPTDHALVLDEYQAAHSVNDGVCQPTRQVYSRVSIPPSKTNPRSASVIACLIPFSASLSLSRVVAPLSVQGKVGSTIGVEVLFELAAGHRRTNPGSYRFLRAEA